MRGGLEGDVSAEGNAPAIAATTTATTKKWAVWCDKGKMPPLPPNMENMRKTAGQTTTTTTTTATVCTDVISGSDHSGDGDEKDDEADAITKNGISSAGGSGGGDQVSNSSVTSAGGKDGGDSASSEDVEGKGSAAGTGKSTVDGGSEQKELVVDADAMAAREAATVDDNERLEVRRRARRAMIV